MALYKLYFCGFSRAHFVVLDCGHCYSSGDRLNVYIYIYIVCMIYYDNIYRNCFFKRYIGYIHDFGCMYEE